MTQGEMAQKTLEQMKIGQLKENIAGLPDKVDLTATQLKARFDANPTQIKDAFDDLVTFLQNSNTGHSAASYIGSEAIDGVGGFTNVRDQIACIKGQMNNLALGNIPDASITTTKLASGAVVGAIAAGEIPSGKLASGAAVGNIADGSILRAKLEAAVQQALFSAGDIKWRAAANDISGWVICDGRELSKTEYAVLYAAIGDTFNTTDPATGAGNFRVPNLKGRVAVAYDNAQAEFNLMGAKGGEKMQGLTENQMPSHNHSQNPHSHGNQAHNHQTYSSYEFRIPSSGGIQAFATDNHMGNYNSDNWTNYNTISIDYATATNNSAGRGDKHNNLQPYIVLQAYIKI